MTAKRFHIINGAENLAKYGIFCKQVLEDEETGEQYISALDLMDLLNELHEENKKLKQVNEMLQMDFAMTERNLIEENEQLQKEAEEYNEDAMSYQTLYEQQLEKFEELQSEIREVRGKYEELWTSS